MAEIPHLAWPLRLAAGRLMVVEQDTIDDVRQCVHVLLRTPPGARPLAPHIGIDDPVFTGVDADEITGYLGEYEPRAQVTVTSNPPDSTGRQQVIVAVTLTAESDDDWETDE